MDKQYRVNDFFCGCGGMGLGFKRAGYITTGAWDFDKFAVESYRHNVDEIVRQADIQQMRFDEIPAAEVWTFGFPCQDLSIAGPQKGLHDGERSRLFFEIMRLLDELDMMGEEKPKVIMAENVKALKPYLEALEKEYSKRGYKTYYILYNSKYWGVPQNRERYFVLGVREDLHKEFKFPEQSKIIEKKLVDVLDKEVDESYYLSDEKTKAVIEAALKIITEKNIPATLDNLQKVFILSDGMAPTCDASYFKGTSPGDVGKKRRAVIIAAEATNKGYAMAGVGDSINLSHPNSETRRGRVGVAQTLLTGREQCLIDPYTLRLRYFTTKEYGRLQGFPMDDRWEQVVSNTQAYKQFGNAVTVNVAEAIAKAIIEQLLD